MLVFTAKMAEGTTQPRMPCATFLGGEAVAEASSNIFEYLHDLAFMNTSKPCFAVFLIEGSK
jgi:hypothetical protein